MRTEGPSHYPYILGMALNLYRIDNEAHYLYYITKPLFNILIVLLIEFLTPGFTIVAVSF